MMVWRASADTVARFQHDDGEAGMLQRMRRTEAGGAGTDDGDIDFGGEGHESVVCHFVMPGLVPGIHVFLFQYPRRGWPGQARP